MSILDTLRPPLDLRVLVTGGASGVGAAIARAFHEAGARVHVCDIDRSALDRLHADSPGITGSMADASVEADVDMVFDDLRGALGGLDVLVSNAGIAGPIGAIQDVDRRAWERTVAVNLNSQYYFAHRAVPLLRGSPRGACLIAIGSRAASIPDGFRSVGVSTRWAVLGLVKALASELGAEGVRVNAILGGAPRRSQVHGVPATEVAGVALFLCSPAARHLTGQIIGVDSAAELRDQWEHL